MCSPVADEAALAADAADDAAADAAAEAEAAPLQRNINNRVAHPFRPSNGDM